MKKSVKSTVLIIIFALLAALALSACKGEEKAAFKVTFNANGGEAVAEQSAGYIQTRPMPMREGYIFEGWYVDADFSAMPVSFPYEVFQNVTLHARWITEAEGSPGLVYRLETDAETYTVTGYDGGSHMVLIPMAHLDKPVTAIADGAFNVCHTVTEISISAAVSSVGSAFSRCNNLNTISVAEGNDRYKAIDGVLYTFDGIGLVSYPPAKTAKTFDIPEGVERIENAALRFCRNLENVVIPESVQSIAKYFEGCYSLRTIDVESQNAFFKSEGGVLFSKDGKSLLRYPHNFEDKTYEIPEGTETIEDYAFNGSALETLDIPSTLERYSYIEDCKKLTSFDVNPQNAAYMSIGGVLFSKDASALLQYPQAKVGAPYKNDGDEREYYAYHAPEGVIKINSWAFNSCAGLNKITLPSSLEEIAPYAFSNLEGQFELKEVIFSAGSRLTTIGEMAFMDISSLELVKLTALEPPSLGTFAFYSVDEDMKLLVPSDTKVLYEESPWNLVGIMLDGGAEQAYTVKFFTDGGSAITNVRSAYLAGEIIPQKENSVFGGWRLDSGLFGPRVAFPLVLSEDLNLYAKWYSAAPGTEGLTFVLQPATDTYAVNGYSGFAESVEVPPTHNGKIVSEIAASAFARRTHVTDVSLPETVTEIKDSAFAGGYDAVMRLESVAFQGNALKSIGNYAFSYCRKLRNISIPSGVESIGSFAFENCVLLESVSLPDTVRYMGSYVFSDCSQLVEINVAAANQFFSDENGILYNKTMTRLIRYPSGKRAQAFVLPESVTEIASEAFHSAQYLLDVALANVKTIGTRAFWYCALTSVIIPDGMTTLNPSVFRNTPLRSITLSAAVTTIEDFFHGLNSLEEINAEVNAEFCSLDGVLYSSDKKTLLRFPSAKKDAFIVPAEVESIGAKAFFECKITHLTLNDGLESIGIEAFQRSTVESITFCGQLAEIKDRAFMSSALRSVFLSEEFYPALGADVFAGAKATVFAPQGIVGELETAEGWKNMDIFSNTSVSQGLHLVLLDGYYKLIRALDSSEEITVPSDIGGTEIRQVGSHAFSPSVRKIIFTDSIRKLDGYAFSGASSLTTVVFGDSGALEIGANAFYGCGALTNIVFGGAPPTLNGELPAFFRLNVFVPPSEDFSDTAFALYDIYSNVSVADGYAYSEDGEGVCIIGYLNFSEEMSFPSTLGGKSVVSIGSYVLNPNVVSAVVPASVLHIYENAFSSEAYDFSNFGITMLLKEIVFEGNSPVVIDAKAFFGLSLETIALPDGTLSVSEDSFNACEQLTSITISAENGSYSSIDGVLFDKAAQTIIRYPSGRRQATYILPSTVTDVGRYAFWGAQLVCVTLGENVQLIRSYAFEDSGLLDISLPMGLLRLEPFALKGCRRINKLSLPLSLTQFDSSAVVDCATLTVIYASPQSDGFSSVDGVLFDKTGERLISYPSGRQGSYTIPEGVKHISAYAFYGSLLNSISLPQSVIDVGSFAFAGSLLLKSIDTANVSVLPEGMLKDCAELETLTTGYIEEIGAAFAEDCAKLRAYEFPAGLKKIGARAFAGCAALTEAKLKDGIQSVGNEAFLSCSGLTVVELPSEADMGEAVLKGATAVMDIKIGLRYPLSYIFGNLSGAPVSLKRVAVLSAAEIPTEYFMNCAALQTVTIPQSVAVIRPRAFEGCSSLAEVEFIGTSLLASIEEAAFRNCTSLVRLTIRKEIPPSSHPTAFNGNISGMEGKLTALKVYVPSEYVAAYSASWEVSVNAIN
ncbi:MAG: leucine-rich repeat protein [Clostridia bacterium]|nr:leucine-rich repeat protein [Clostridia bacterium]